MKTLRRLSLATTIATIAVIAIGGYVRASGSGDGCPDWPKCFGRWFPPLRFEAIVEYTHRYAGAIAIVLMLVTTAFVVLRHRQDKRFLIPVAASAVAILGQAGLGGFVVWVKEQAKTDPSWRSAEAPLVTFHIATAMLLVAALVAITVRSFRLVQPKSDGPIASARTRKFAIAALVGVYALILIGAYTRGEHAGLAFPDWPLMDGTVLPSLEGMKGVHFAHRLSALLAGFVVGGFAVHVSRQAASSKPLKAFAHAAAGLFILQAFIGGLQVITKLAAVPVALHVLLSSLILGCLVAALALTIPLQPYGSPMRSIPLPGKEPEPAPVSGAQVDALVAVNRGFSLRAAIAPYVALTKPRIIVLLLITTVPSMILAAGSWPGLALVSWTMLGGTLGAGAANAINMVIDRDIDAIMSRTKRRPLPSHSVTPGRALTFAMFLAALSFVILTQTTNLLAALLVQSAILFYVFVYTLGLKRSTPQNIVIGGAAGAAPALVGWAAVQGSLSLEAWLLFSIIFAWTPAHFWALAIRFSSDYKAAGVPMLPVVAGRERTQRAILAYTLVTVVISAALWLVADLGWVYAASWIALGAWFSMYSLRLYRAEQVTSQLAMGVFKASISYLGLLFLAVGADVLI